MILLFSVTAKKPLLKQQAFVYCEKPHLDVGDGDGGKHSGAQLNALADPSGLLPWVPLVQHFQSWWVKQDRNYYVSRSPFALQHPVLQ